MKAYRRTNPVILILIILFLAAGLVFVAAKFIHRPEPDPHAGQVLINDGFDMVWITPLEGVAVNIKDENEFRMDSGNIQYTGSDYNTLRGIDVSAHQFDIDWSAVAASGVDFAIIRVGYRGYTVGGLMEDEYFYQNIEGALNNGIKVGVYLFSQAINVQEALEEADFVLSRISGYDIQMPVYFDWEKIDGDDARTDGLDPLILTDCTVAFCEKIRSCGYQPGVYFNRYIGYYGFDLSKMTDYTFWVAVPGDYPDFYYSADMWQYSFNETVPGISTESDMNMYFIPVSVDEAP